MTVTETRKHKTQIIKKRIFTEIMSFPCLQNEKTSNERRSKNAKKKSRRQSLFNLYKRGSKHWNGSKGAIYNLYFGP